MIIFPIFTNGLLVMKVPIQVASDNDWIGFFACYYGAIFGGIIGGLFTFLGVRITLKKQESSENEERSNHQKMLYTQLVFTYEMFSACGNLEPEVRIESDFVIYDHDWNMHLIFVKNLTKDEFRWVVNWFYAMGNIENAVRRNGSVTARWVSQVFLNDRLPEIEKVIEKLKLELEK